AVNLDPANMLMNGFDVSAGARILGERVRYVHAHDARAATASRSSQEVPLGHGDIDWLMFLGILEEIGYRGWMTVERGTGAHPLADVAAGVKFLGRLLG